MPSSTPESLTIGRLARAAGVGVETIRYYQQRGLLPVPPSAGAYHLVSECEYTRADLPCPIIATLALAPTAPS